MLARSFRFWKLIWCRPFLLFTLQFRVHGSIFRSYSLLSIFCCLLFIAEGKPFSSNSGKRLKTDTSRLKKCKNCVKLGGTSRPSAAHDVRHLVMWARPQATVNDSWRMIKEGLVSELEDDKISSAITLCE